MTTIISKSNFSHLFYQNFYQPLNNNFKIEKHEKEYGHHR
jgi:hypothetical protein